jgi:hypothetical protein
MELGTFLVALGVVGVLIACGIAFNLRLYSQGAFGKRRFRRSKRLEPAFVAPDTGFYYTNVAPVDKGMSHYARRIITAFLGIAIILVMVVALIISTAPH